MSYFLLKTYDKQQAESLSFLKHVSWNQYHSKFKTNDIVFIYIIDEEIFKCAAKIVGIREKNKAVSPRTNRIKGTGRNGSE